VIRAIRTKFGKMTQFDPLTIPTVKKFEIQQRRMPKVTETLIAQA